MKRWAIAAGALMPLAAVEPAWAQATESVEQVKAAVLNLIRALVDQGVLTASKAQEMLRQAGLDPALLNQPQVTQAAPPPAEAPKPVVRVPYVPEIVKDELREQVKQEVLAQARAERWGEPGALPAWLSKLSIYGDVRFRFQREDYDPDNSPVQNIDAFYQLPQGTTRSSTDARDRLRLRARVGFDAKVSEQFTAGARLTTTNGDDATANPVSYNVDQGRYWRALSTGFDLAYLQWAPIPSLRVEGGRTLNPYFSSDLIWSPDLTFDGVSVDYEPRIGSSFSGLLTAGAHPLQTSQTGPFNTAPDQWIYAAQAGLGWSGVDESNFRLGVAYYDFSHVEGQLNPANPPGNTLNALTAPLFRQRGNTMFNVNFFSNPGALPVWALASKFRLENVILQYEFAGFDPIRLGLQADWVRNVGFDAAEIRRRLGTQLLSSLPQDASGANGVDRRRVNGYRIAAQLGRHELARFGDWQTFAGYRYLERDAVVDGLTSADYRLGGTDVKGVFAGFNLGLAPRASLTLRHISGRSIDSAPKFSVDTWFVDLMGRF